MYTATYLEQTGLRAVWVDVYWGPWDGPWDEDLAGHYYKGLRDVGYLGAFFGDAGPPWGLHFTYSGVPSPGVRAAYHLDSTNGGMIIDDFITRNPDEVFIDITSHQINRNCQIMLDENAVGGQTAFIPREFINSPSCCLAVGTAEMILAPGNYTANFRMKIPDNQDTGPVAQIYVGDKPWDWHLIARQRIAPVDFQQAGQYQDFTLSFTLDRLTSDIVFRIDYLGGTTDLFVDYIHATREGSLGLPVFAPLFIGPTALPQRLTETPQFAEDFERAGGIVLTPDEFLAALNPEYIIELASPILGSEHPALTEAREQLAAGSYLKSLLTVRNALRVASPESLPLAPPAPPPPAGLDFPN